MSKEFKFYTPLEIRKAKDESGKVVMRLGGIASTADEDSDGEFLDPSGFTIEDFETVGVVNWHHQAKDKPSTIIGEPAVVEIRKDGFYVETDLYPSSTLAQEVYELAQVMERDSKTRRLGYSIEGVVIERGSEDENDPEYKKVKKALITGLAITHMPKNAQTFAQIIKGHVDNLNEEETEKSLDTTSGAPLIPESVDKNEKNIIDKNTIHKSNYKVVKLSERDMTMKIFDTFSDINIEKANKFNKFLIKIDNIMAKEKISDNNIQKAMEFFGLGDNDKNPFLEKSAKNEDTPEVIADKVQKETYKDEKEVKKAKENGDGAHTIEKAESGAHTHGKESKLPDNLNKGTVLILKKAIEKSMKANSIENKALATLVKAQLDENAILKGKVDDLLERDGKNQELIKALSGKVTRLSSAPRARKSITKGYSEKESFQKAKETETTGTTLSISKNRNQILDVLDTACFAKGYDEEFGKAVLSFDSQGTLPSNIINRLKSESGINIVN